MELEGRSLSRDFWKVDCSDMVESRWVEVTGEYEDEHTILIWITR